MYLWLPKLWTWIQFKNVLWFRSGLTPKARDFNWHNVIGVWTAIPLAIVVAGAVPISYPWASNLVYRIAGDTPPPPPAANPQARPAERAPVTYVSGGVDAAWAASQAQIPNWRTMTTRLATSAKAPVIIAVDEGYAGQPQLRTTFTFDRATGSLEKAENFESLSSGRQLRSWLRFAHTGEIYGLTGQTIAGLVSAGSRGAGLHGNCAGAPPPRRMDRPPPRSRARVPSNHAPLSRSESFVPLISASEGFRPSCSSVRV